MRRGVSLLVLCQHVLEGYVGQGVQRPSRWEVFLLNHLRPESSEVVSMFVSGLWDAAFI